MAKEPGGTAREEALFKALLEQGCSSVQARRIAVAQGDENSRERGAREREPS